MSTWIVFGIIVLAVCYVVCRILYKKDHGCSSCSGCKNRGCHDNFKAYIAQRDKVNQK